MPLIALIHNHALSEAESGKWQAVADLLNAQSITKTDPTPLTYARLGELYGDKVRQAVSETMRQAIAQYEAAGDKATAWEITLAHNAMTLSREGIRIDLPDRLELLSAMVAKMPLPDPLKLSLLRLGVWQTSLAAENGLPPVTADECRAAWQLDQLEILRDQLQSQFDAVKNQIGTTEQPMAVAELRAMADSLEA